MLESDYQALEAEHRIFTRRHFVAPVWHKPESRPCQHVIADHANLKRLDTEEAASDGGWFLYGCKVCGNQFSAYIEG